MNTNRFDKSIVFCVDQEHADEMRRVIGNLNNDIVRQNPDYVCRITSEEGDIGRAYLSNFQELERNIPAIVTTSQLLTTGVDVQTCKNIVIAKVIGSMTDFKQIIGRGTRVREDYNKLFFNIIDYTGSATEKFADPEFDGEPSLITQEQINDSGETETINETVPTEHPDENVELVDDYNEVEPEHDEVERARLKYYFDEGHVEILAHMVHEIDPDGNQLRVISYTDYTAEKVRTLYSNSTELRKKWANPQERSLIITMLEERGITLNALVEATNQPDADPFDLLCHIAFNAPIITRRQRTENLRHNKQDFFDKYGPDARLILGTLLDKYAEYGVDQFNIPDTLKVPPISEQWTLPEIINKFNGVEELKDAVAKLQSLLYAEA
jgi:type I restriction enzyme R subunit